jgi:hypothetical protein
MEAALTIIRKLDFFMASISPKRALKTAREDSERTMNYT